MDYKSVPVNNENNLRNATIAKIDKWNQQKVNKEFYQENDTLYRAEVNQVRWPFTSLNKGGIFMKHMSFF